MTDKKQSHYQRNKEAYLERSRNQAKSENHRQKMKEHYQKNKEIYKTRGKNHYQENKEAYLERSRNRSEYGKEWYAKNKDKVIKKHILYTKNKYNSDPLYKLIHIFRVRLNEVLGSKRSKKTKDMFGCDLIELKQHLQNQFEPWMNWDNWGLGEGKWVIDHKIPISSATTEEEVYKLNHYTNLKPMGWMENLKKGNRNT